MNHDKEQRIDEIHQPDDMDIDIQACSATDCTGLIPALPEDDAGREAYEDLYPYIPQAKNSKKQHE